MKKRTLLLRVLLLFFSCVFVFSAWRLWSYWSESRREQAAFDELTALLGDVPGDVTVDINEEDLPEDPIEAAKARERARIRAEKLAQYAVLKEKNPDFYGWVQIEGTKLNYPVMFTPDRPQFYLHHAFDGSYSSSGVPFLDETCTEEGGMYLLYGHHMKNGSMFATLSKYSDESFWREHPTVKFDTLKDVGEYEIMSAFYTEVGRADDGHFRYYRYTDLSDKETFQYYVDNVLALSLYDTGITAEYGDQLVALSTCSYHTSNGRFVIVARKKAEE